MREFRVGDYVVSNNTIPGGYDWVAKNHAYALRPCKITHISGNIITVQNELGHTHGWSKGYLKLANKKPTILL